MNECPLCGKEHDPETDGEATTGSVPLLICSKCGTIWEKPDEDEE